MPTTDFQVHDGLLAVQQTFEDRRLRIALIGELDLANVETASSILREAVPDGDEVVIDLAKLEFIDSTGLAMLVVAMREGGERLSFLPSEHASVRRLLSLTGLDERMNLAPTAKAPAAREDVGPQTLLPAA